MGASVTPDVGLLTLTGFAPTHFAVRQQGSSHFLLVLANPGAVTPYDPASTGLPGDEHVYFTSRRRVDNPWIAEETPGDPTSGPDISIGGQKLELPLGRSIDGECQVRIIDAPGVVTVVACDIGSILISEGSTDLHLDSTAVTSGKWVVESDAPLTSKPATDAGVNANGPILGTSALFGWTTPGPWVRSAWWKATFDGTEGGGPAWTPGQKVGFRFRVNKTLDTGGGNEFVEIEDDTGVYRVSASVPGFDLWNIPTDPLNHQVDLTVWATANALGQVTVRLGGENMYPSFNLVVQFTDIEVVECDDVVSAVDAERYYTSQLADTDARQRLLGWPYFLKLSSDGGVTFDTMVYAGYHKRSTMERSLTFLLVGGDAGRGRRVSKAWADLDPVEDFTP